VGNHVGLLLFPVAPGQPGLPTLLRCKNGGWRGPHTASAIRAGACVNYVEDDRRRMLTWGSNRRVPRQAGHLPGFVSFSSPKVNPHVLHRAGSTTTA